MKKPAKKKPKWRKIGLMNLAKKFKWTPLPENWDRSPPLMRVFRASKKPLTAIVPVDWPKPVKITVEHISTTIPESRRWASKHSFEIVLHKGEECALIPMREFKRRLKAAKK